MKILPVLLLFLWKGTASAQQVPDAVTHSPESFAVYLQNNYSYSNDRLNTLYKWITNNIRYDMDSAMYFNWSAGYTEKIAATLRRRKGVCENFASLFADIARRINIPAYVVHGYPSWSAKTNDNSHSWVALQQEGEWYLCDPTWDAQASAEKYFMRQPADFIQTHIPFDPLWQLLEKPLFYKSPGTKFMYKDSLAAFLQLDSLQQFQQAERRMQAAGNKNSMTKNWEQFNRMNIAIIAGERDEQLYNDAVALLNKANQCFNNFVQYRNNQFTPLKRDEEIKEMLQPVAGLLKEAAGKLDDMGKIRENFQYDTESIRIRIASLRQKTGDQSAFIKVYLETDVLERIRLFN